MGCMMFWPMVFIVYLSRKHKISNKLFKLIFGFIAYILLFVGFIYDDIYCIFNPTKA